MKRKTLAYLAVLFVLVQVPSPLHAQDPSSAVGAKDVSAQRETPEIIARREALEFLEGMFGRDDLSVTLSLKDLGLRYSNVGRYAEAEPLYLRALAIFEASPKEGFVLPNLANTLNDLGSLYRNLGRYAEAEPLYLRSLAIREAMFGTDHPNVAGTLNNLGLLYDELGRYAEAESLYLRVLAIREATASLTTLKDQLWNSATLFYEEDDYEEAEKLYLRVLQIQDELYGFTVAYEQAMEESHQSLSSEFSSSADDPSEWSDKALEVEATLRALFLTHAYQGHYEEAHPVYQQLLVFEKTRQGRELIDGIDGVVAASNDSRTDSVRIHGIRTRPRSLDDPERHSSLPNFLSDLAVMSESVGRLLKAEEYYREALDEEYSEHGPGSVGVAWASGNLGEFLFMDLGRFEEARPLLREALTITESSLPPGHPHLVEALINLGNFYRMEGNYLEAEPLLRKALITRDSVLSPDHPDLIKPLNWLGHLYTVMRRYEEAGSLLQRALAISESTMGPNTMVHARNMGMVAELYMEMGRDEDARPLREDQLRIEEAQLGPLHQTVGFALHNLGRLDVKTGRHADGARRLQRALAINYGILSPDNPSVAMSLLELAEAYIGLRRYTDATPLIDHAISVLDMMTAYPFGRLVAYRQRASISRVQGDLPSALSYLGIALEGLDLLRPDFGGDERVRAGFMEDYAVAFDNMVSWQLEAGEPELALNWLERGRSRVLRDQLAEARVDLRSSIPADVLAPLEQRETDAEVLRTSYQRRLTLFESPDYLTSADRASAIEALRDSLASADLDLRQASQDIRSASPLWQNVLTSGGEPVGLAEIQSDLVPADGLLLIYEIGEGSSHVFVIPPSGEELEVVSLDVTSQQLDEMVPAGEFRAPRDIDVLATLRTELFPDGLWDRVLASEEIIVVPDGALHRLPFEALVVAHDGEDVRYWLDEGPPVRYAASATVLYNVAQRAVSTGSGVLSLSDAIFDPFEVRTAEINDRADVLRAGFIGAGGPLDRLPGTALETEKIQEAFGADEVTVLQELDATESSLRARVGDHRYLHLATHGLVDERRGSASLAITPVPGVEAEPDNDGFLELHEIYGLDLSSVALAVLSACKTNVGERFTGEGVFTLSRGFLAAGAQRVVATQWQVADEATSVLIGAFFETIAQAERAGEVVDYARALRAAKQRLRTDPDHPQWADPFFWAPFIIIGKR